MELPVRHKHHLALTTDMLATMKHSQHTHHCTRKRTLLSTPGTDDLCSAGKATAAMTACYSMAQCKRQKVRTRDCVTCRAGTCLGVNIPSWQKSIMPSTVVSVCSNVRVVANSNPYTESTALLAKTMPVAEAMFNVPYRAGFTQALDGLAKLLVALFSSST